MLLGEKYLKLLEKGFLRVKYIKPETATFLNTLSSGILFETNFSVRRIKVMKKKLSVILLALLTVFSAVFSISVFADDAKTVELTGAYYVSQKTGDIGSKKQNARYSQSSSVSRLRLRFLRRKIFG